MDSTLEPNDGRTSDHVRQRAPRWRLLPGLVALALSSATLAGQDGIAPSTWSRFRGPNGSGVSSAKNLPVHFGEDEGVRWKTALPPGHSSPVLSGQTIFLTATEREQLLTLALDANTGKELWRAVAPRTRTSPVVDKRNNEASPSAAVDADTVIVFFPDSGLLAYDHAGKQRWHLELGPFDNVYGMGASPILFGDRVFLVCDQNLDSYVIAVSKTTGRVLWRAARPHAKSGHCTPIIHQPKTGVAELIVPGSFYLDAYDTTTGERIWWVKGLSFEMKSTPMLHDGVIYINGYGSPLNQVGNQISMPPFDEVIAQHDADKDGAISKEEMPPSRAADWFSFVDLDHDEKLDARDWSFLTDALASKNGLLAIRAGGSGDCTQTNVLWSYVRPVPQLPSPLVVKNVLYLLQDQGGRVVMVDPKTGEQLKRVKLPMAIENYYASPVAGDGKLYFAGTNGAVSVVSDDGEFSVLSTNHLADGCYATPALADGRIFIRTTTSLYCIAAPR